MALWTSSCTQNTKQILTISFHPSINKSHSGLLNRKVLSASRVRHIGDSALATVTYQLCKQFASTALKMCLLVEGQIKPTEYIVEFGTVNSPTQGFTNYQKLMKNKLSQSEEGLLHFFRFASVCLRFQEKIMKPTLLLVVA